MNYILHKKDTVEINNLKFNEEVLKLFDPEYESPPNGWVRCYFQGRKHCISNGRNQVGCDFPWNQGDNYINSIPELKLIEKQIMLDRESSA
tara:strand:+ start:145 stop:417 length:273 start_codon:yes stop_codon:yes gene_type:complete